MFVYFCQHLTVIIVNHSHTCLSLKIVLTLPRRLFPVITALQEHWLFYLPSPRVLGSRDSLSFISLLPCVDAPLSFLRICRPLLVRVLDFTSQTPPIDSCNWRYDCPWDVCQPFLLAILGSSRRPCQHTGSDLLKEGWPKSQAVSDLWDGPSWYLKWDITPAPQHEHENFPSLLWGSISGRVSIPLW